LLTLSPERVEAFEVAMDGFASSYNRIAEQLGYSERMILDVCTKTDVTDSGQCRFRMSRGGTVVAISALDGKAIKGLVMRWMDATRPLFEYSEPEAVLMRLCSLDAGDLQKIPVFWATIAIFLGPQASLRSQSFALQGTTWTIKADPQAGFACMWRTALQFDSFYFPGTCLLAGSGAGTCEVNSKVALAPTVITHAVRSRWFGPDTEFRLGRC